MQHNAVCTGMRRIIGEFKVAIDNAVMGHATSSDNSVEVDAAAVQPQAEAEPETERTEQDSVLSREEEGGSSTKATSAPVNSSILDGFNRMRANLEALNDFFDEISIDLLYISARMAETDIFSSFVVPALAVREVVVRAPEEGRNANVDEGQNAGAGPPAGAAEDQEGRNAIVEEDQGAGAGPPAGASVDQ